MAGRKSLKEELSVMRRYEQLAPKVFSFVQEMFDSENKTDKQWAADWLKPAYSKMIPQQITGANGGAIQVELLTPEQQETLKKLTLPNVDPSSPGQSNNGNDSGTAVSL